MIITIIENIVGCLGKILAVLIVLGLIILPMMFPDVFGPILEKIFSGKPLF